MTRYDECTGVTSARGNIFQRERPKEFASIHVKRHNRTITAPPPPGCEWLQPNPLSRSAPGRTVVRDIAEGARVARAFDPVRITMPADADLAAVVRSLATIADLPPGLGTPISVFRMDDGQDQTGSKAPRSGTQAVARALDILDAIAERPMSLADLAEQVGVSPPTCYRIARAMADRGLLVTSGRNGFALGPKAEELGIAYAEQRKARPAG